MRETKRTQKILILFLAVLCLVSLPAPGLAEEYGDDDTDRTLSPYFLVMGEDEGTERLPLKSTSAEVDIAGVIADVRVKQVYRNEGDSPIEAVYVFPGSTSSAVYGMRMTVGGRVIVAKIKEREEARATYEQAKKEGKSTSLLEQQRPNVFQMNVANIMPGDEIKVELFYTENLMPTEGVYEFVYPSVVGPRYSNMKAGEGAESENWVGNPYLGEGEPAPYDFGLEVNVSSGIPIKEVSSPSHDINVDYQGTTFAAVSPKAGKGNAGDRDFILRYRLQGGAIESGLMLYEGKDENFFMLSFEPPERVRTKQIPPREYIYIVDISGSMHGFPLSVSKKLMKDLLGGMRPVDSFNVLLFAGSSEVLSGQSLSATPDNIRKAIGVIDAQRGGGSTELLPALRRALAMPQEEGRSRSIVIITDGYVTVEAEAFDLIRNNLGNANVFAFGIGSSVNRFLVEGLAHAGFGEPFVVTDMSEARQVAGRLRSYIQTPVLTDISVDFNGFDVYDVEPPGVPDVFAERPVVVFGKWRGRAAGSIVLTGRQGDAEYTRTIDVKGTAPRKENAALRYLWARHRIKTLGDYNRLDYRTETREHIIDLGLRYNLLTAYTSFIAVDEVVRNANGDAKTVKQPLPMPAGVSNHAVGGNVATVPEPETYALMAVVGVFLLWLAAKVRKNRDAGFFCKGH